MGTSTLSPRVQGIHEVRAGNPDQAIALLTPVVMADAQDLEVQAFLGVAYSQKGLHAQARQALQTAVEGQPQNAHYRFNLGVALERAGERQRAAHAYRETLQIDPEHAQARERLRAIAPAGHAPLAGMAHTTEAPAGPAWREAPWLRGRDAPGAEPPAGRPGSVPCPQCHEWSKPGLSCEWCSAPLKRAPAEPRAPWAEHSVPGAYAASGVGYSVAPPLSVGEAFWRRFAASLIDTLVLGLIGFALLMGATALSSFFAFRNVLRSTDPFGAMGGAPEMSLMSGIGPAVAIWVAAIGCVVAIAIAYPGRMLSTRGQTLGKMALGLRVVGPDGGNPSFWRAVVREVIGKWLSGCLFCLGFWWMLWDEQQQTWHDKIAGTRVLRH